MRIFGQFPGGRHLGEDEIKNVTDVISSRSPYRFSGLNLKQYCNKLENEMSKFVILMANHEFSVFWILLDFL